MASKDFLMAIVFLGMTMQVFEKCETELWSAIQFSTTTEVEGGSICRNIKNLGWDLTRYFSSTFPIKNSARREATRDWWILVQIYIIWCVTVSPRYTYVLEKFFLIPKLFFRTNLLLFVIICYSTRWITITC